MDFNKILNYEFDELNNAIQSAKHDYHTFCFATIQHSIPQTRTVVLRSINKKKNRIAFHTDQRSPKLSEINYNNNVSGLFYDKNRRIQLRIIGKAIIEKKTKKLKSIWSSMKPESKLCYMGPFSPSQKLNYFQSNLPDHNAHNISNENNDFGYNNFCRITIEIDNLDWLKLHHKGHQRILYNFKPTISAQWISA